MSVRVVARIRPLLDKDKELSKDIIVRAEGPEGKQNIVRIPNPKNESEEFSFTFNAVYDMPTSQEELFTNEVAPHLKSLFQGLDVTIFAYGVTGTGKTHTMRGGLKMTERGVIPRLLSGIYRRGRKVTKDSNGETSVSVTLSYYEIYNDKVFDLFETPDKRTLAGLPLRAAEDGKTVVVGLSERACDDLKDFERLYIEANNNRSTGATKLNAQSSRSHAILMVKVIQTHGEETLVSTASAIDLAGSEDNRRTDNGKERMVESASINKSLFVLSQCIDAIGRGDKRIPFRESKMTRILSLGQNNGITIMILNLAPLRSYHLDTLSSLNVSSRAKRIEVREIENEVVFKQPPRASASISGSNMQRQPLRPRDVNAHAHISAAVQKGDKPPKAFSVYSDKGKSSTTRSGTVPQRTNSTKRRSESGANPRPTKMVRPNPTGVRPAAVAGLSAAKIEEMVEKKVSEILASRTQAQPPPPVVSDISEAVQRRLDALERKVEESGAAQDERTEGLRFLLMAKQHKERGEDASALKMFEMALPFFPGQQKLLRKIDAIKAKIKAKKDEAAAKESASDDVFGHPGEVPVARKPTAPFLQLPTPQTSFEMSQQEQPQQSKLRKPKIPADYDDEYNGSALQADPLYEDDDSFSYKTTKSRKPKSSKSATRKSNIRVYADTESAGPLTPRTKNLLDIVNSRDVAMIKGLVGVGAKKARDLVEFLELQNEDEGGRIESLDQLMAVPGVGKGTVIRAYEGITA